MPFAPRGHTLLVCVRELPIRLATKTVRQGNDIYFRPFGLPEILLHFLVMLLVPLVLPIVSLVIRSQDIHESRIPMSSEKPVLPLATSQVIFWRKAATELRRFQSGVALNCCASVENAALRFELTTICL